MSLPKEPRQKMINMMYLVLTALLALNVSSEILNAFKTVDNSLKMANSIIGDKNNTVYLNFEKKVEDPKTKDKALIWQPRALQAKKLSEDIYKLIDEIKLELKKEAKLEIKDGKEDFREDDLEASTRLLAQGKRGKELFEKLTKYKAELLNILKPEDFNQPGQEEIKKEVTIARANFGKSLPLDLSVPKSQNAGNDSWQMAYFRMTPTVAALTILSKYQNDIRNSESQMVDYCLKKVGEVVLEYDQFQAIASQSTEYLMPGQELTITGGVGAFSKAAQPTVTVDGSVISLNPQGVAEYKTKVGGPGSYSKKVKISFKKPDGTDGVVEKDIKYTVGSPTGITVSADAVKVLYIGLDNPISIAGGSGKGAESVSVSIDNGQISNQGNGKYVVNPETVGKATFSVTSDGKTTPFEFRVKNVPNPIAMIGQNEGGRVAANVIKAQQGVRADLRDFVFEGVKFDIIGYTVYATGAGFSNPGISPNSGAYFNADSKRILEKLIPGSTLVIDEIKAVGPGGTTRKLQPLVFNLY